MDKILTTTLQRSVISSIERALWGESSSSLRNIRFRIKADALELVFNFDTVEDRRASLDIANNIGAEVVADFPDFDFRDEIIFSDEKFEVGEDFYVAYTRA